MRHRVWYYVSMMFWQNVETEAQAKEPDQELRDLLPAAFPDRPLQAGLLFVPRDIQIDGDRLVWSVQGARYKRARSGMLSDFVGICTKADYRSAILSCARKWGVLGICQGHSLPCSHNQYAHGLLDGVQPCLPMLVTPLPRNGSAFQFWEPLALWGEWSKKVSAVMGIAAQLDDGKKASFQDWNIVKGIRDSGSEESGTAPYVRDLGTARRELAWELDSWISIGQVRPRIAWSKQKSDWRLSLDAVSTGPNLFGLIALYLATEVAGTGKGIAFCSSCGDSYEPERRLNPKYRNYCPKCRGESGKQAARRDAARDFRRRQREKGCP